MYLLLRTSLTSALHFSRASHALKDLGSFIFYEELGHGLHLERKHANDSIYLKPLLQCKKKRKSICEYLFKAI